MTDNGDNIKAKTRKHLLFALIRIMAALSLVVGLWSAPPARTARAAIYAVTEDNDAAYNRCNEACTLRDAQLNGGGTIDFDLPDRGTTVRKHWIQALLSVIMAHSPSTVLPSGTVAPQVT